MSSPAMSALRGRKDPILRWTVIASLVAHLGGLGVALIVSRARAATPLRNTTRPIVAKLVRLGKPRDPKLLPRIEKAPPPPKPVAKVLPPEPKAPKVPDRKKLREATPERSDDLLDAAISRIAETYDVKAKPEPLAGDPEGSAEGNAADAGEGDRYLALVQQAVRRHYQVPSIISERERLFLNATVVIFVAPDGHILRREIEHSSGNEHFDAALLGAVDAADPLPPPPEGWREVFQREGLGLRFKI